MMLQMMFGRHIKRQDPGVSVQEEVDLLWSGKVSVKRDGLTKHLICLFPVERTEVHEVGHVSYTSRKGQGLVRSSLLPLSEPWRCSRFSRKLYITFPQLALQHIIYSAVNI